MKPLHDPLCNRHQPRPGCCPGARTGRRAHRNCPAQPAARRAPLGDYQMLVLPGGFSYADALGAGKLLALDLQAYFADAVRRLSSSGKAGDRHLQRLPGAGQGGHPARPGASRRPAARHSDLQQRGQFECRWVTLQPVSRRCLWTTTCQSRFTARWRTAKATLSPPARRCWLRCKRPGRSRWSTPARTDGPAAGQLPHNPNGSAGYRRGVQPAGQRAGPDAAPRKPYLPHQHPRWTRGESCGLGLAVCQNGVQRRLSFYTIGNEDAMERRTGKLLIPRPFAALTCPCRASSRARCATGTPARRPAAAGHHRPPVGL
jgi:phosphoribosylformylglycinamidine synthase subunit PurQ / glutaminase